jgi:hypothetical protein
MRSIVKAASVLAFAPWVAAPVAAQTDYYNTGTGRPLRIEDAHAVEFRAIEMNIAPLRLERARGGVYRWSVHPEVALGLLPRTHLEVGLPLAVVEAAAGASRTGIAGVEMGAHGRSTGASAADSPVTTAHGTSRQAPPSRSESHSDHDPLGVGNPD